jgi:hypothetical protein
MFSIITLPRTSARDQMNYVVPEQIARCRIHVTAETLDKGNYCGPYSVYRRQ